MEKELKKMTSDAETAVNVASTAAGGIGAVPIPFADAPLLIANQVALMASIAYIFNLDIKRDGLKALVIAALSSSGAAVIGRMIVTNMIKIVPGLGWLVGGAISAATAAIITYAIGYSFIELCKALKRGDIGLEDITGEKGKAMFAELYTKIYNKKAEEQN